MSNTINTALDNLNNAGCCISNQAGYAVQPVPVSEAAPGFSTIVPNTNPCQAMPGGGKKKTKKKMGGKKSKSKSKKKIGGKKSKSKSKKKMGGKKSKSKSKKKMGGVRRMPGVRSASLKRSSSRSKPNSRKALSGNDRPVNRHSSLHPVPRQGETMARFRRRMTRRRNARNLPTQLTDMVTRRNIFTPPTSPRGGKKSKNAS